MAETKSAETKTAENPRKAIREARAARLRVIDGPPNVLKVYAANESIRASMRHANGSRFRAELGQGVEWPNDNFTKRRLADGSISLEPGSGEQAKPDDTKNPREQAAANKPKPKKAKDDKDSKDNKDDTGSGKPQPPAPRPAPAA